MGRPSLVKVTCLVQKCWSFGRSGRIEKLKRKEKNERKGKGKRERKREKEKQRKEKGKKS